MVKKIEKVALFGGTHGNEMTGIFLIKKFLENPYLIERPTLKVFPFLSNPRAIKLRVRYTEIDLNRCFDSEDIDNLYLVGANTHPGAGIPGVITTADLTTQIIFKDLKQVEGS